MFLAQTERNHLTLFNCLSARVSKIRSLGACRILLVQKVVALILKEVILIAPIVNLLEAEICFEKVQVS